MEKRISILGASGSVGKQALDVAESSGYKLDIISAEKNVAAIESAIRRHSPRLAFMSDESAARDLKIRVSDTDTKVFGGCDLAEFLCENLDSDTVVNAISGYHGLAPTLAVIDRGARLALANKESLVIAGDVVMRAAKEKNAEIKLFFHCCLRKSSGFKPGSRYFSRTNRLRTITPPVSARSKGRR